MFRSVADHNSDRGSATTEVIQSHAEAIATIIDSLCASEFDVTNFVQGCELLSWLLPHAPHFKGKVMAFLSTNPSLLEIESFSENAASEMVLKNERNGWNFSNSSFQSQISPTLNVLRILLRFVWHFRDFLALFRLVPRVFEYLENESVDVRWYSGMLVAVSFEFGDNEMQSLALLLGINDHLTRILQFIESLEAGSVVDLGEISNRFERKSRLRSTIDVEGVLFPSMEGLMRIESSFVYTEATKTSLQGLALIVAKLNNPVLLYGPASSGKTEIIRELARRTGNEQTMIVLNLSELDDPRSLVGNFVVGEVAGEFVWKPGPLYRAVNRGYWMLFEDIDNVPEDLVIILLTIVENGILTIPSLDKDVKVHSSFRIFGTLTTTASDPEVDLGRSRKVALFSARSAKHVLPARKVQDVLEIISLKHPKLSRVAPLLVKTFLRFRMTSASQSGEIAGDLENEEEMRSFAIVGSGNRILTLRDLFKFCSRVDSFVHQHSLDFSRPQGDHVVEHILREAIDCFAASIAPSQAVGFAHAICEDWGIQGGVVDRLLKPSGIEIQVTEEMLRIGRVEVSLPEEDRIGGRSEIIFANTNHSLTLLERIAVCTVSGESTLLIGETGTGKTHTIQYLAQLLGKRLVVVNMNRQTDISELVGGFRPVDLSIVFQKLQKQFFMAFSMTFSEAANEKYLDSFSTYYARRRWPTVFKMVANAIALVRKKESVHNSPKKGLLAGRMNKWDEVEVTLSRCMRHYDTKSSIGFQFEEGPLTLAIRQGDWLFLDEINLSPPETLQILSGILENKNRGIILTERGDEEEIRRHPDFRLFAAMNPPGDLGKQPLMDGIRSRFTEIFFPEPEEKTDVEKVCVSYLENVIGSTELSNLAEKLALYHLKHRNGGDYGDVRFSLRHLCRCLLHIRRFTNYHGLKRAVFNGLMLGYACLVSSEDRKRMEMEILDHFFEKIVITEGHERALQGFYAPIRHSMKDEGMILFGGLWLKKGGEEEVEWFTVKGHEFVVTSRIERHLRDIALAVLNGTPVLLQGETSVGKTSMVEYIALETCNKFTRINNHEHTDVSDYFGAYGNDEQGNVVFVEGPIVRAVRHGYWILLDELNLAPSEVLESLNRLLDSNKELRIPDTQEVIKAHPNFALFATQNPPGLYEGRKQLSRAFRSRFMEFTVDEVPSDELVEIIRVRCRLPKSMAQRMVDTMLELQRLRSTGHIFAGKQGFITSRDLFKWGSRKAEGGEISLQECAIEGIRLLAERVRTVKDRKVIIDVISKHFKLDPGDISRNLYPQLGEVNPGAGELCWTSSVHRVYTLVERALQFNEPVLLVGNTGIGKTSICQLVAQSMANRLVCVNCHQNMESSDLVGGLRSVPNRETTRLQLIQCARTFCRHFGETLPAKDSNATVRKAVEAVNALVKKHGAEALSQPEYNEFEKMRREYSVLFKWADGPLTSAMREGKHFLLDEISLAENSVLERINSVLENVSHRVLHISERASETESIVAVPSFQLLATMNPGGDFGKKELSPSLRNRFTEIWLPDVIDPGEIGDIVDWKLQSLQKTLNGQEEGVSEVITKFYLYLSEASSARVGIRVSIRDIIAWIDFVARTWTSIGIADALFHGAQMTFLDGVPENLSRVRIRAERELSALFAKNGIECKSSDFIAAIKSANVSISEDSLQVGVFRIPRNGALALSLPEEGICHPDYSLHAPTTKANLLRVARALQLEKPILLEGPPGVGKTSLILAFAEAVGKPCVRMNLSEETEIADLFGSELPVEGAEGGTFEWKDGSFLNSLKQGNWIVLDELNLASESVLEGLNACFDHRREIFVPELGRSFSCPLDFKIFACQNPMAHTGRKGLPQSFLNRFSTVYTSDLVAEDYVAILQYKYSIQEGYLVALVNFGVEIRSKLPEVSFNLRDMQRWCDLISKYAHGDVSIDSIPKKLHALCLDLVILGKVQNVDQISIVMDIEGRFFRHLGKAMECADFSLHLTADRLLGFHIELNRSSGGGGLQLRKPPLILKSQKRTLVGLLHCVQMGWPCCLFGSDGSGKRELIKLAGHLVGKRVRIFTFHSAIDSVEILGGFESRNSKRDASKVLDILRKYLSEAVRAIILTSEVHKRSFVRLTMMFHKIAQMDAELGESRSDYETLDHILETSADILSFLTDIGISLKKSDEDLLQGIKSYAGDYAGVFQWIDSVLVGALLSGDWIILDGANHASPALLDRLNGLLEPNGTLFVNEKGTIDGDAVEITPAEGCRIFLTSDEATGRLSSAMLNRLVEFHVDIDSDADMDDVRAIVNHHCPVNVRDILNGSLDASLAASRAGHSLTEIIVNTSLSSGQANAPICLHLSRGPLEDENVSRALSVRPYPLGNVDGDSYLGLVLLEGSVIFRLSVHPMSVNDTSLLSSWQLSMAPALLSGGLEELHSRKWFYEFISRRLGSFDLSEAFDELFRLILGMEGFEKGELVGDSLHILSEISLQRVLSNREDLPEETAGLWDALYNLMAIAVQIRVFSGLDWRGIFIIDLIRQYLYMARRHKMGEYRSTRRFLLRKLRRELLKLKLEPSDGNFENFEMLEEQADGVVQKIDALGLDVEGSEFRRKSKLMAKTLILLHSVPSFAGAEQVEAFQMARARIREHKLFGAEEVMAMLNVLFPLSLESRGSWEDISAIFEDQVRMEVNMDDDLSDFGLLASLVRSRRLWTEIVSLFLSRETPFALSLPPEGEMERAPALSDLNDELLGVIKNFIADYRLLRPVSSHALRKLLALLDSSVQQSQVGPTCQGISEVIQLAVGEDNRLAGERTNVRKSYVFSPFPLLIRENKAVAEEKISMENWMNSIQKLDSLCRHLDSEVWLSLEEFVQNERSCAFTALSQVISSASGSSLRKDVLGDALGGSGLSRELEVEIERLLAVITNSFEGHAEISTLMESVRQSFEERGYSSLFFTGRLWTMMGMLKLDLVAEYLQNTEDPVSSSGTKVGILRERLKYIDSLLKCIELQNRVWPLGHDGQDLLRGALIAKREALMDELRTREVQHTYRKDESRFDALVDVIKRFRDFHMPRNLDNGGNYGVAWIPTATEFISRLEVDFGEFAALTAPIISSVEAMRHGSHLSQMAQRANPSSQVFRRLQWYSTLSSSFNLLSGELQALKDGMDLDSRQFIVLSEVVAYSAAIYLSQLKRQRKMRKLTSRTTLNNFWEYADLLYDMIGEVIGGRSRLQSEEQSNGEPEGEVGRYEEKGTDELLRSLFAGYFDDEEFDPGQMEGDDARSWARKSTSDIITLSRLHEMIFSNSTKKESSNLSESELFQEQAKKLIELVEGSLGGNSVFPKDIDSPYLRKTARIVIRSKAKRVSGSAANLSFQKVSSLVNGLKRRCRELLEVFNQNEVLGRIIEIANQVLHKSLINQSTHDVSNSLELLLLRAQEWELHAPKEHSLADGMTELMALALEQRFDELKNWVSVLDKSEEECEKAARSRFGSFHEAMTEVIQRWNEAHVSGSESGVKSKLVEVVSTFLRTSRVGEFATRFRIVEAYANRALLSEDIHIDYSHLLINVTRYFDAVSDVMSKRVDQERRKTETELKKSAVLAKWEEQRLLAAKKGIVSFNFYALKGMKKRALSALSKYGSTYRGFLSAPAVMVITDESVMNAYSRAHADSHKISIAAPHPPAVDSVMDGGRKFPLRVREMESTTFSKFRGFISSVSKDVDESLNTSLLSLRSLLSDNEVASNVRQRGLLNVLRDLKRRHGLPMSVSKSTRKRLSTLEILSQLSAIHQSQVEELERTTDLVGLVDFVQEREKEFFSFIHAREKILRMVETGEVSSDPLLDSRLIRIFIGLTLSLQNILLDERQTMLSLIHTLDQLNGYANETSSALAHPARSGKIIVPFSPQEVLRFLSALLVEVSSLITASEDESLHSLRQLVVNSVEIASEFGSRKYLAATSREVTSLLATLKDICNELLIVSRGKPDWLKRILLDIHNKARAAHESIEIQIAELPTEGEENSEPHDVQRAKNTILKGIEEAFVLSRKKIVEQGDETPYALFDVHRSLLLLSKLYSGSDSVLLKLLEYHTHAFAEDGEGLHLLGLTVFIQNSHLRSFLLFHSSVLSFAMNFADLVYSILKGGLSKNPPPKENTEEGEMQDVEDDGEAKGMGEGEGKEDVSDELSQDQLDGTEMDKGEEEGEKEEDQEDTEGVEMDFDFQAELDDIDKEEESEEDEEKEDEKEDEIEQQLKDDAHLDTDDSDLLNEKIWDGEDEGVKEEDKKDKDHQLDAEETELAPRMDEEEPKEPSKDMRNESNEPQPEENQEENEDGISDVEERFVEQIQELKEGEEEEEEDKGEEPEEMDLDNLEEDRMNLEGEEEEDGEDVGEGEAGDLDEDEEDITGGDSDVEEMGTTDVVEDGKNDDNISEIDTHNLEGSEENQNAAENDPSANQRGEGGTGTADEEEKKDEGENDQKENDDTVRDAEDQTRPPERHNQESIKEKNIEEDMKKNEKLEGEESKGSFFDYEESKSDADEEDDGRRRGQSLLDADAMEVDEEQNIDEREGIMKELELKDESSEAENSGEASTGEGDVSLDPEIAINLNLDFEGDTDQPVAMRSELEVLLERHRLNGNDVEASELWAKFVQYTDQQAALLSERLKILLAPSNASNFEGDYKTGKRVNMKRVLEFVASGYRKDKIWMRRTKLSKRDYQIAVAVDDSQSMKENHAGQIALECIVMLSSALSRSDVGSLAVIKFGEEFSILHGFEDPAFLSAAQGANVLSSFSFSQRRTDIDKLIDLTFQYLSRSRRDLRGFSPESRIQIVFVVSDGRIAKSERIARIVRNGMLSGVLFVFILIDRPERGQSVLDIKSISFGAKNEIIMRPYLEGFPFPFYVIVRDVRNLQQILSEALTQWFELVKYSGK